MAFGCEGLFEYVPAGAATSIDHPVISDKIGERDLACADDRVIDAHRGRKTVAEQIFEMQCVVPRPFGHQTNCEIDVTDPHRRQHVRVDAFLDEEADARAGTFERQYGAWHEAGRNRRRSADANLANAGAEHVVDIVACVPQFRLDKPGAGDQRPTRLGRGHPLGSSVQKLDAERLLKLLNAFGDGGLRQIQRSCRLPHGAGLGHDNKVPELAQLHCDADSASVSLRSALLRDRLLLSHEAKFAYPGDHQSPKLSRHRGLPARPDEALS